MKAFVIAGAMLLALMPAFAQKKNKNQVVVADRSAIDYEQGKEFYDKSNYTEAVSYFELALKANPDYEDALYYAGKSYQSLEQHAKALEMFDRLFKLNPDYAPRLRYEYGVALAGGGRYEDSEKLLEGYLKSFSLSADQTLSRHQAQYQLDNARAQKTLRASELHIKPPVKLSSVVNSGLGDYMPVLDVTGAKLYFTSNRKGGVSFDAANKEQGDEDLYYIEKVNGEWTAPKLLPEPINTADNDGAASFSADGQLMVFSACGRPDGVGSCDLYYSVLDGTQWTKPVNVGNVVNSTDWDAQPTVSNDGSMIIFASGRDGSYGIEDLYMIEKNKFGEWGPAMNLGPVVNTPFRDESPFFSQDGKTLYFASSGHPGYGGLDLFKTTYVNGKWTTPVNLGPPINTPGDDRFFTIGGSGEVGYFSSNRDGKYESLYEIEIPESMRPQPTVVVEGTVTNAKTGARVSAYVMVEDLNSGELVATLRSNSVSGKYLVVLPAGKSYSVSANKEAFFFHSERFDVPLTSKFETIRKDVDLRPIEKGARVVINNIFFETGKATLSGESKVELEKAIDLLNANPTMVIEVGGHTDNVGDDAFNMKLSHDRAKSVRDYLVQGGIASARVQAKGYGESNPIATNDTDDGRKANRRTEFIILEF